MLGFVENVRVDGLRRGNAHVPMAIHSHSYRNSLSAPQVDREATIPYEFSRHYLFRMSIITWREATSFMNFESLDEIRRHGFQGFTSIAALQASACRDVPAEQGVYLVLRPDRAVPTFLAKSVGGHFKGKDPTVDEEKLRRKWIDETAVVYIGKAGQADGNATLRSRLLAYMRFGQGEPIGHWGGRYIWQLEGSGRLLVCWKVTPDQTPAVVESALIQEFKGIYGKRPFANLRD